MTISEETMKIHRKIGDLLVKLDPQLRCDVIFSMWQAAKETYPEEYADTEQRWRASQ